MLKSIKLITGTLIAHCLSNEQDQQYPIQTLQYRANNPIQDRICYGKLKNVKGFVAGVFDGHGGYLTADFAAGNFLPFLQSRLAQNQSLKMPEKAIIQKSMIETYDDLENSFLTIFKQNIQKEHLYKSYRRVGACALTAIILKDYVCVGNAGDCEGVIFSEKGPLKLNKRLNAGEPFQQERLKKQFPQQDDIYKCIKNTNYCYVKGRLQPTRSLGDFYLKYKKYNFTKLKVFTGPYITHKPMISAFTLQQNHQSLLLATDGLWDELDEHEMNKLAMEGTQGLGFRLFNAALMKINERNKTTFEELEKIENRRDLHDDISLITVDLHQLRQSL